jgi:hypothetical protein
MSGNSLKVSWRPYRAESRSYTLSFLLPRARDHLAAISRTTIDNDIFHGAETLIETREGTSVTKAYDGRVSAEEAFVLLFHIGSRTYGRKVEAWLVTGATNFPAPHSNGQQISPPLSLMQLILFQVIDITTSNAKEACFKESYPFLASLWR